MRFAALVFLIGCSPVSDGAMHFESGKLEAAIEAGASAADSGWGSARVKFNIGNAHYRRGDLPRAIGYWRAAGQIAPRTGAVNHNLALARSELSRVPSPVGAPYLWMRILTPGELGLLAVLLTTIASGGLVRRRRTREGPRWPWVLFMGLAVGLGLFATWGWWVQVQGPVVVVVDDAAPARDAPSLDSGERFSLPAGSEVAVVQRQPGFLLVETGDGERGWVADGGVFVVQR